MTLEYRAQCPAYSDPPRRERLVSEENCRYCGGCGGIFINGVECLFSEAPTGAPKYEIGEKAYYKGLPYVIRKRYWDKWEWKYIFARERTPHSETWLFRTRREYEEAEIREEAKSLRGKIETYCEKYKIPIAKAQELLLK